MVLLSFLFWLEVLLLFSAGVCYFSGRWTSRERPNGLYRTFQAFWHVVLSRHVDAYEVPDVAMQWRSVQIAVRELDALGETGDEDALLTSGWPDEAGAAAGGSGRVAKPSKTMPAEDGGGGRSRTQAQDPSQAVTLTVHVAAEHGPASLLGRSRDILNVRLQTSPEHGEANRELIELLAEQLGIRVYQVHLVSGHYREVKTLRIAGMDRAGLEARLDQPHGS